MCFYQVSLRKDIFPFFIAFQLSFNKDCGSISYINILTVDNALSSDIYEDINHWLEYYQKFINNEISEEEYRNFKYQYPKAVTFNTKNKKSNDYP